MTKHPIVQFLAWSLLLCPPAFAQEPIQIEIDSAPVEVEIPQPTEPAREPEPAPPTQAETPPPPEEPTQQAEGKKDTNYGVAIGIGALVAGLLAALAGGGGGSGGGSTPQHP